MAFSQSTKAITRTAGAAGVSEHRFVVVAADGDADHAAAAQGAVDGVCGMTVLVGESFPMMIADGGVVMIEAGVALAVGADVATDASGKAIAWVDAGENLCVGKMLTATGADGEIGSMHFIFKKVGDGS